MIPVFVCPDAPDDVAEAYCLGRLTLDERELFEDHYLVCPRCAELVQATEEFIVALQAAIPQPNARG